MTAYNTDKGSVQNEFVTLGRFIITSHTAMKRIIEEEADKDPKVQEKLDYISSQYEFKDEVPKSVVRIKIDETISQERYDDIMFGIGQKIRDQALIVRDKRGMEAFFADTRTKM